MSEAAGVPATTSAKAIGLSVQAARRIDLVTPFPVPVLKRFESYCTCKYGLRASARASPVAAWCRIRRFRQGLARDA